MALTIALRARLDAGEFEVRVQLHPASLPSLRKGKNELKYVTGDHYGLNNHAVEIRTNGSDRADFVKYLHEPPADFDPKRTSNRAHGPFVAKIKAPPGMRISWFSGGGAFMAHQGDGAPQTKNSMAWAADDPRGFKESYRAEVPAGPSHWHYNADVEVKLVAPAKTVYLRFVGDPGVNNLRIFAHCVEELPPSPSPVRITHAWREKGILKSKVVTLEKPGPDEVTTDDDPVDESIEIAVPSSRWACPGLRHHRDLTEEDEPRGRRVEADPGPGAGRRRTLAYSSVPAILGDVRAGSRVGGNGMRHGVYGLALLSLLAGSSHAYIDAMNSTLEQFSGGFGVVAEGVLEKVDLEKKAAVVKLGRTLKGKPEVTHARLDIGAGGRGYPDAVLKHLVPGAPVVVWYYWGSGPKTAVYLNRFFLEFYRGEGGNDPAKPWWHLNAVATLYNRTYNGSVEELVPLLESILAGKVKGPPLDLKLPSITQDALMALPPWGQAGGSKKLPPPFRRRLTADKDHPRDPDKTGTLAPGLRLESFEGSWEALPDFSTLKPTKSATAESIGVAARPRDEGYALRFSGFLDVPKDGVYGFALVSNDGARLTIGAIEVVDNDHLKTVVEGQGEIALRAGKHAFRIEYFQHSGFQVLEAYWQAPGLSRTPIPASSLWRTP